MSVELADDIHVGADNDLAAESVNVTTIETGTKAFSCPIPLFRRVRTVVFDIDTFMFSCTCCQFQRIGIPCVHVYAVVKQVHPTWEGFTHHQLSVRWWSVYVAKAYPMGESCPVSRALASLAAHDIVAPTMPCFVTMLQNSTSLMGTPTAKQPGWELVTNYQSDHLHKLFSDENQCFHGDLMGHTQTLYI